MDYIDMARLRWNGRKRQQLRRQDHGTARTSKQLKPILPNLWFHSFRSLQPPQYTRPLGTLRSSPNQRHSPATPNNERECIRLHLNNIPTTTTKGFKPARHVLHLHRFTDDGGPLEMLPMSARSQSKYLG